MNLFVFETEYAFQDFKKLIFAVSFIVSIFLKLIVFNDNSHHTMAHSGEFQFFLFIESMVFGTEILAILADHSFEKSGDRL